jgi:hypothetical protein
MRAAESSSRGSQSKRSEGGGDGKGEELNGSGFQSSQIQKVTQY